MGLECTVRVFFNQGFGSCSLIKDVTFLGLHNSSLLSEKGRKRRTFKLKETQYFIMEVSIGLACKIDQ